MHIPARSCFAALALAALLAHPPTAWADDFYLRVIDFGIPATRMLRTDLGDEEGPDEWDYGRIPGKSDPANDDDIKVRISGTGLLSVAYKPTGTP